MNLSLDTGLIMKKFVFVAYTNTDCTEGRGYDIPIAVCESETTAIRLAKGRYVQGSNGPVRKVEVIEVDGEFFYPTSAVKLVPPTKEDLAQDALLEAKRVAIEKARSAGLTEEDILLLKA